MKYKGITAGNQKLTFGEIGYNEMQYRLYIPGKL
jgi:hypothetical protein